MNGEPYQVEDVCRSDLLRSLLAEEEETLASVGGPGNVVVGRFGLLTTEVRGEVLLLDGVGTEPEVLLLEDEAPRERMLAIAVENLIISC